MKQNLKYPIKYAVLELKENGGFIAGYEEITRGFVVSKCYIVESSVKYLSNGESKLSHKVVFPFRDLYNFKVGLHYGKQDLGEPVVPKYDANNNPYPCNVVSDVFDNYEEAYELATQKNDKLHSNLILEISLLDSKWKEKYSELEKRFYKELSICKNFEELISIQTNDMEITRTEKQIQLIKKKIK